MEIDAIGTGRQFGNIESDAALSATVDPYWAATPLAVSPRHHEVCVTGIIIGELFLRILSSLFQKGGSPQRRKDDRWGPARRATGKLKRGLVACLLSPSFSRGLINEIGSGFRQYKTQHQILLKFNHQALLRTHKTTIIWEYP